MLRLGSRTYHHLLPPPFATSHYARLSRRLRQRISEFLPQKRRGRLGPVQKYAMQMMCVSRARCNMTPFSVMLQRRPGTVEKAVSVTVPGLQRTIRLKKAHAALRPGHNTDSCARTRPMSDALKSDPLAWRPVKAPSLEEIHVIAEEAYRR